MKNFIIYSELGQILQFGSCPDSMLAMQTSTGRKVLQCEANPLTQWVSDGVLVDRPVFHVSTSTEKIVADGTSEVVIAGLPAGTDVRVLGPVSSSITADGSDIVMTFLSPGDYTIRAVLFPFQDYEVIIHAT
ncbi:hypothetical protein [Janthinobacterium fluminis]|uniref:Uncharacterized protein n=1 Tax=Janthinobacterium fluminis TaxID=2987524 RepID=A0ABT5K0V5_9BURK|nr:hypothetical protein [Janthinobacterium fluminis]MDC8758585.1 hypothetical protein [Janthinobacterium fluminis]